MLHDIAIVLIFTGGFFVGGLTVYSIERAAMASPKLARAIVQKVFATAGLKGWFRIEGEEAFLVCPVCRHTDKAKLEP